MKVYWSDRDIAKWAKVYTRNKRETLLSMEYTLGVPHSTLWWCFTHRLEGVNGKLYTKVTDKLEINRKKGGKRR